jgi:MoaA/NifB/PqqE/SkfB family radical SAM enzyme
MKKFIKNLLAQLNYLINSQKIPDITNNLNIETTSRCNLKCKFCAYDKRDLDMVPHETMTFDFFTEIVNQALDIGYKNIGLTPTTGDIFMDKEIFNKFEYLDKKKSLVGYYFYTNFIPLNNDKIAKIFDLIKLKNFGISIYGHDKDSFQSFSGGTESSYNKLVDNLNFFFACLEKNINQNLNIEISQRTKKDFNLNDSNSRLSKIIKKILSIKKVEYSKNSEFNNWGGIIKGDDVKGLGIKLNDTQKKKIGSCSLIYSRMMVGASGLVNACACRDANFTLAIGDLKKNKLNEIINLKNRKYEKLIKRQEKNDFPKVCKSCDFYKSIYQKNDFIWSFRNDKIKHYSLKETLKTLNER